MKLRLILPLVLILVFSGVGMAFSPQQATVTFSVHVDEWVEVELPETVSFTVEGGTVSESTKAVGKIMTNTPLKFDIATTRVAEEFEINNWFYYRFRTGTTSRGGGNPGVGFGGYSLKQGITNLEIELEVRLTHTVTQGGKREWYDLPAGDYSTTTILTFYAP